MRGKKRSKKKKLINCPIKAAGGKKAEKEETGQGVQCNTSTRTQEVL